MKRACLLILLFSLSIAFGQNVKSENNNIAFVNSPGSWNDGYSFGVNYEYQDNIVYVGPELYVFPNLNGFTYAHIMGRMGFNKEWNKSIRIFTGARLGFISRETVGFKYANLGAEIGAQYTLHSYFIRITGSRDMRSDSKLWSDKDHFMVNSVWISIGKRF